MGTAFAAVVAGAEDLFGAEEAAVFVEVFVVAMSVARLQAGSQKAARSAWS